MAESAVSSVAFDASSASSVDIATHTSGISFNSEATATASEQNFQSDAGAASSIASITRKPLPLTTIYTPPASCSQIVTWDGNNLWQYGTNQTGGECYPPNFHNIYNSFYTPGVCPDAWTSAGMLHHSSGHDAMCCPKYLRSSPDYWIPLANVRAGAISFLHISDMHVQVSFPTPSLVYISPLLSVTILYRAAPRLRQLMPAVALEPS